MKKIFLKNKILSLTTSIFIASGLNAATGVPLFDNLGSLLSGDIETLSQNTGLTKGERQEGWFSPPPIIQNMHKAKEEQNSNTILTRPSVNFKSHITLGSYSGDNLDGNNFFDYKAKPVKVENSFFLKENDITEYLTLELKPIQ